MKSTYYSNNCESLIVNIINTSSCRDENIAVQFYTWALTGWDKSSNRMFGDFWRGQIKYSVCEWVTSYSLSEKRRLQSTVLSTSMFVNSRNFAFNKHSACMVNTWKDNYECSYLDLPHLVIEELGKAVMPQLTSIFNNS